MTESQSISKRKKRDYNSGRDRLSDLPLSIIRIILTSLPTQDAVRTSILSREWRYTWTDLPKLEFISNADGNQDEKTASEERLKEFISYALSVHKGLLRRFKLGGVLNGPCPNLDEWLIRLSTKDIRELRLTAESRWLLRVHSSVYSCNKLTCLHLSWCNVGPPPPTFRGFSFLKNLALHRVKISNATVESVVSNSPLLQSLQWYQFTLDGKNCMLRIHAPNLKYLELIGYWRDMFLNAPLLAEIRVTLTLQNLARLLDGAPNLQNLSVVANINSETQDVHFGGFWFEPNFRMEKLRVVEMDEVRGFLPEIKLIEFLLERSPWLETMSVLHSKKLGTEEIKDLTDKILSYTRASPTTSISVSAGALLDGFPVGLSRMF